MAKEIKSNFSNTITELRTKMEDFQNKYENALEEIEYHKNLAKDLENAVIDVNKANEVGQKLEQQRTSHEDMQSN